MDCEEMWHGIKKASRKKKTWKPRENTEKMCRPKIHFFQALPKLSHSIIVKNMCNDFLLMAEFKTSENSTLKK